MHRFRTIGLGLVMTWGVSCTLVEAGAPRAQATKGVLFDGGRTGGDARILGGASVERIAPASDRKMIHTAAFRLEVASPHDAIATFTKAIGDLGGYLASRENTTVTCRVPAARFEAALAVVRKLGRVLAQSRKAQDVTKQHIDLTIRLDNARKARARLLALLDKATAVKDILAIEKELMRLTTEIERIEGELAYLNDRVAMSSVTVEFKPVTDVTQPRTKRPSRFDWIRRVGAEHVLRSF